MPNTIASTDVGGTGLSTVGTNGQVLTSNGTTLSWQTPSAGTSFSAGTTGFTPNTATTGTVTLAGTLNIANGGTGLTSFTAGQVHYGSFSTSSNFVYDGSGNLIVGGNTTPSGKSGNLVIESSSGGLWWQSASTAYMGTLDANPLVIYTNNAERMRISSAGNVGIGTVPKTWVNGVALEVGPTSGNALWSYSGSSTGDIRLSGNTYFNNAYFYAANGPATQYRQVAGVHYWSSAATGTANASLTFSDNMTLDATGNLSVNGTIQTTGSILNSSGRPMVKQTGGVLQVVTTILTSVVSTGIANNSTFYNISGFSVSITPSSTSSRILVMVEGVGSSTGYSQLFALQLLRNGTVVGAGSGSGYRSSSVGTQRASADTNSANNFSWHYVDSPATTSAITYQIAVTNESSSTFNLNTTGGNVSGQIYSAISASNITVLEIAG